MTDYRNLKSSAMRTISAQWLTDPLIRSFLEQEPKSAALLPDLEEAHSDLTAALGGSDKGGLEAQIAALRDDGDVLDARHDRKYRGVHTVLEGLIELADEPETRRTLGALRSQLQPEGLPLINESWASEAGHAATAREGLDKSARATLRALPSVEGRTLEQEVQQWLKAGDTLGPIAAEKAALERQRDAPAEGSDARRVQEARQGWVRVAKALESNLDLARTLSATDRAKVLSLLHTTAARASRRSAVASPAGEGDAEKV